MTRIRSDIKRPRQSAPPEPLGHVQNTRPPAPSVEVVTAAIERRLTGTWTDPGWWPSTTAHERKPPLQRWRDDDIEWAYCSDSDRAMFEALDDRDRQLFDAAADMELDPTRPADLGVVG